MVKKPKVIPPQQMRFTVQPSRDEVPHVAIPWPAPPNGKQARVLAMTAQLAQSQWWPAMRIQARQMTQLFHLLDHARMTVPFYRDCLDRIDGMARAQFDMETVRDLPILTRKDIQRAGGRLQSVRTPKSHGSIHKLTTSGSSGEPISVKGTELTSQFVSAKGLRYHQWFGRDLSTKNLTMRSLRADIDIQRVRRWASASDTGPGLSVNHLMPMDRLFEILRTEAPAYLQVHPTVLRELIRISRAENVKPEGLREVRAMGEAVTEELRRLCEDAWGVPLHDNYSCQEVGIVALECPHSGDLHTMDEDLLVEILRDDGKPCAPGELGRVVVTSLHNYATPLIRYDLRDYAVAGAPCSCGRGLATVRRIAGRSRNLAVLPTGEKTMPLLATEDVWNTLPIRQYQIIQRTVETVDIILVADRALNPDEETTLRDYVGRNLGYPFAFTILYVDDIPRAANGKFEIFKSEVEA